VKLLEEGSHGAGMENEIATGGRVSSNIPKCPDGLLPNVIIGTKQQPTKDRHCTYFHNNTSMFASSTCNVGKSPSGLELQGRRIIPLKKLNETGNYTAVDNLLYGRISLNTQQTAELGSTLQLEGGVRGKYATNHLG